VASKSPPAVSRRGGHGGSPDGHAPESNLFLEDLATFLADAGYRQRSRRRAIVRAMFEDRRSATGRPIEVRG
jgi:hypothetical protein